MARKRWATVMKTGQTLTISSIAITDGNKPAIPKGRDYRLIEVPEEVKIGMIRHGNGWEFPGQIEAKAFIAKARSERKAREAA